MGLRCDNSIVSLSRLTSSLAQKFDSLQIHQLQSEPVFEEELGFVRLITATLQTLEVQPFMNVAVDVNDGPIDLLLDHEHMADCDGEVEEIEQTKEKRPDDLVRWLEEVMAEHEQDSADLIEMVEIAMREDAETPLLTLDDVIETVEEAGSPSAGSEPDLVPPVLTLDDFFASLSVSFKVSGPKRTDILSSLDGKPVGHIHRMGDAASNLKATCKMDGHANCGCWVLPRIAHTDDEVWRSLVRWLAAGRAQNHADHQTSADAVKREFGMRPRARK